MDEKQKPQAYIDPHSIFVQRETGLTQRQIINTAKRNGWPTCKIYGRIWVCSDFEERLKATETKGDDA